MSNKYPHQIHIGYPIHSNLERMQSPLITVVTINLNNATGLSRTLRSLKPLQKDPRIELLGVDGLSTDGSVDMMRQFYTRSKLGIGRDQGVYDAMNKGLGMASGKYVIWLNSGDEFLYPAFEQHISIIETEDAALVTAAVEVVPEKALGNPKYIHIPKFTDIPTRTFPHQSTFFRRDLILELGGYDTSYKILADRDLILKCCARVSHVRLCESVIARFYSGGISSTSVAGDESPLVDYRHGLITHFEYLKKMRRRTGNKALLKQLIYSIAATRTRFQLAAEARYEFRPRNSSLTTLDPVQHET